MISNLHQHDCWITQWFLLLVQHKNVRRLNSSIFITADYRIFTHLEQITAGQLYWCITGYSDYASRISAQGFLSFVFYTLIFIMIFLRHRKTTAVLRFLHIWTEINHRLFFKINICIPADWRWHPIVRSRTGVGGNKLSEVCGFSDPILAFQTRI